MKNKEFWKFNIRIKKALFLGLLLWLVILLGFVFYSQNEKFFFQIQQKLITSGLSQSTPEKTYKGFTLYPVTTKFTKDEIKKKNNFDFDSSGVVLIDMQGEIIHRWIVYSERARLLANCNLLLLFGMKSSLNSNIFPDIPRKKQRGVLLELDWEGNIIWKYESDYKIHHDLQRLANGNTIFLIQEQLPKEFKSKLHDKKLAMNFPSDSIIEINPAGETVWRWDPYLHLDINDCGNRGCESRESFDSKGDWLHINALSPLGENQWYQNGDERFHPDNLIVMAHNWWKAFIISKKTGQVVWEYSGDYKGGLSGGHEAHMIQQGLPGAGNILIFDNGSGSKHKKESYILEVDPITKKVVWVFDIGKNLFSQSRGSVERLPNGNTLISEDSTARIIEVTKDKEIVWEFKGSRLGFTHGTRANRYDYNYCQFFK